MPSWFWHTGSSSTVVGAGGGQVLLTSMPAGPASQSGGPPTNVGSAPLEGGARLNGGVCAREGGKESPRLGSRGPSDHKGSFACRSCSWNPGNIRWVEGGSSGAQSLHWPEAARLSRGKPESNSLTPQPCPAPSSHTNTLLPPTTPAPVSHLQPWLSCLMALHLHPALHRA